MLNSLILLAAASALTSAQADYSAPPPPVTPSQPSLPQVPAPSAVAPGQPAAVAGRTLQGLPGTTVRYYEVRGRNPDSIKKSIAKQRPKDASGEPITASTNWDIGASFTKRTENGQCRITTAKATFTATADLPRLANERALRPEVLDSWRAYVAGLEAAAAAKLWFIHDHLGDVEKAILASSCEGAQDAGAAAVARLKQQEAAIAAQ